MTHLHRKQIERARRAASRALADPDVDTLSANCGESDAQHLRIRVQLMMSLRRFIEASGMTQCEAADFFDLVQPRISNLVNLKTDQFSADLLIDLHARAGMTVQLDVERDVEAEESVS